jgi:predicted  nucleic acid-binding Zn-ribbon protein
MTYAVISLSIVVAALGVELYRCKRKLRAYESPSRMEIKMPDLKLAVREFERELDKINQRIARSVADDLMRRRRERGFE